MARVNSGASVRRSSVLGGALVLTAIGMGALLWSSYQGTKTATLATCGSCPACPSLAESPVDVPSPAAESATSSSSSAAAADVPGHSVGTDASGSQASSRDGSRSGDGGPAAGYGGATPLFPSQRYKLPPECAKHTVLYGGIYADLAGVLSARPGGITEADLEACGIPYATNKPDAWAVSDVRRLLMYDNSLYALEDPWTWRNRSDGQRIPLSGQHYWALLGIEEVAQRWGLPNLEFVLPLRDCGVVNAPNANGSLCISLSMAKQRQQFDFTIPEGQFIEYQVDKWVREEDPFPWEEKKEKAIARYTGFCPYWAALPKEMRLDRWGNEITCPRTHYVDLAKNSSDALDVGCNSCTNSPPDQPANYIKLSDQRRWKYALETDGWGPSARFYKLLGGGWTVLKDYSLEHLWFIPALQPWVHYIPVRWNGPDEAARLVRWLRANDHVARSVAQNAKQFARAHLTDEGRMCYIKVLFEELAGLYRFSKRPEQYSRAVPIHEEIKWFSTPEGKTTV